MYISLSTPHANCFLQQLRHCFHDIFYSKNESGLKGKMQIKRSLAQGGSVKKSFSILSQLATPAVSTRNLGVIFNDNFNFR